MISHYLAQYLLVLLLVCAGTTYSEVHHITPSLDGPCPQNTSCLTLSQFAANSSYNETNISLLFLPGNHTLDRELMLTHGNNFSMTKDGLDNETVYVKCSSQSARFCISDTISATIKDLHFIGCGDNKVSHVSWLTISGTTFQGVTNRDTVLELSEVSATTITTSLFHSNRLECDNSLANENQPLDHTYFQQNTLCGALYTSFSNVSIISSQFMHNRADIGGAMVAYNSSLYLANNTYSNNSANFGGVMVTSGSTVHIQTDTFVNNTAQHSGGVMVTCDDTFTISSTAFTNNSAGNSGGVMVTFGDSSFDIKNSIFTSNSASSHGGAMRTINRSVFKINNTTFTNNTAANGGVMCTLGNSSFQIENNAFANNTAKFGGVMITWQESSFNISKSTFSNNRATVNGGVIQTGDDSSFNISKSTFSDNIADYSGGVMYTDGSSSFQIENNAFTNNTADYGGVMITWQDSSFQIENNAFTNNTADFGGVMRTTDDSSFNISKSTFNNNRATVDGGVFQTVGDSSFNISHSMFISNTAVGDGGVMINFDYSLLNISNSTFTNNKAREGGIMETFGVSSFVIRNSDFNDNSADNVGGVMLTHENSSFSISESTFSNNRAAADGGVMYTFGDSSFNISHSMFISNSAVGDGGVMITYGYSSFNISYTTFTNNKAREGGVMETYRDSSFVIKNCDYNGNNADEGGGVMFTHENSTFSISKSTFRDNSAAISGGVMYTLGDSSFQIEDNAFTNNTADFGGVMITWRDSSFNISKSTFSNNRATDSDGGVMYTNEYSSFNINHSMFISNTAVGDGGVMITWQDSSFNISNTTFTNNKARDGGVMETYGVSSFVIKNCDFNDNSADEEGGVMLTNENSSFNISHSIFISNTAARDGGVMNTFGHSSFNISKSTFTSNHAARHGGVLYIFGNSSFTFSKVAFTVNTAAHDGGVISAFGASSFRIANSNFNSNSAIRNGGVMVTQDGSSFTIQNSIFTNNTAAHDGGVMRTQYDSSFTVNNCVSTHNKATISGGVIHCSDGTFNVDNSNFILNKVFGQGGGVMYIFQCSVNITDSNFDQNTGSLYSFNSSIIFSGYIKLKRFTESLHAGKEVTNQEGGAITSLQSTVIINGGSTVHISYNQASRGGAILATESSTIKIYGEMIITNNSAKTSGGALLLEKSILEINDGMCLIDNNVAVTGGGIHASDSTIVVYPPGTLQVIGNDAELGGGIYFEVNSKLQTKKNVPSFSGNTFNFTGNLANIGGAMYVADDANIRACSSNTECFFQTLALYKLSNGNLSIVDIVFSDNTATEQGSNLFGGLLDRCIPSLFAEVYRNQDIRYNGVTYLQSISNIELDSIGSQPVRVCFCNSQYEQDCSYQPPTIRVRKGKAFNVSLVAVDQVNHTIDANITISLSSSEGRLGEDQQTQSVETVCTNLTFSVFSPQDKETINLYPDGPCESAILSTSHVDVKFLDCTCPVGFEQLSNSQSSTSCECVCNSALSPYITDCNVTNSSVSRKDTNSWITYINDTDPPGFVIHPNCPFDYCKPQTENVIINFNLPNGADSQCAHDRTGVLCGACKEDLSLSLASSRCVPCHPHWPAVFVVILLAAAIAGILLVAALLALNMTVSVGLINGFIFYANVVSAGSTSFFPSSEASFPSVFIAWLNLDIGIDVCFIDGLDAYTKAWLQLAFPVYIIILVVMVIIISEHSSRFAGLIGKRDPVSTLATLILISYAKLLSITITALSSAVLDYPDGKQKTVWRPDGNVPYFQGKHIPLVLMALLVILIGLPYTIFLFLWQWIVRAPKWKVFEWTRKSKLNVFIATYHVPHHSKYRYWTGLLLIVRIVLYITASVTVSTSPQTYPLITGFLVGGLIFFNGIFGLRLYKNIFVNVVVTALYFNLLALALFSLYDFKANIMKQRAVAYTSTMLTLLLFIGAISYHIFLLIKKEKPPRPEDLNEYHLVPIQPVNAVMTYSVVERPKRAEEDSPL